MKGTVGILSDSHDNRETLRKAVNIFNHQRCDLVLHAGDLVAPFAAAELEALSCPVKAVFGNCDGETAGLTNTIRSFGKIKEPPFVFRFQGLEFLMIHTQFSLDKFIRSDLYDVIVYGHTHRPEIRQEGRSLVINPGETGGWVTGISSAALLDMETLSARIVTL
jgi:putative phosphoesterase